MSIQYTYEIISVDQAARCMEVVYSSEGRQTMHIGARLPFAGESLEDIIRMYAPVAYWREQEREVLVPPVGVSGVIAETPPEQSAQNTAPAATNQFEAIFPTPANGAIGATVFE